MCAVDIVYCACVYTHCGWLLICIQAHMTARYIYIASFYSEWQSIQFDYVYNIYLYVHCTLSRCRFKERHRAEQRWLLPNDAHSCAFEECTHILIPQAPLPAKPRDDRRAHVLVRGKRSILGSLLQQKRQNPLMYTKS